MDSDIILVWGGTNDFTAWVPIGDVTSDKTTEFYGAINLIIEYISTNIPTATVLFVTPLQRFNDFSSNNNYTLDSQGRWHNGIGTCLEDYANAIITACNRFGIEYVDLYHKSGITKFNESKYLGDKLHMNNTFGADKISRILANAIKSQI